MFLNGNAENSAGAEIVIDTAIKLLNTHGEEALAQGVSIGPYKIGPRKPFVGPSGPGPKLTL